jgi:hypothetical protein
LLLATFAFDAAASVRPPPARAVADVGGVSPVADECADGVSPILVEGAGGMSPILVEGSGGVSPACSRVQLLMPLIASYGTHLHARASGGGSAADADGDNVGLLDRKKLNSGEAPTATPTGEDAGQVRQCRHTHKHTPVHTDTHMNMHARTHACMHESTHAHAHIAGTNA